MEMAIDKWSLSSKINTDFWKQKHVQEELTQTVAWVSSYLARFIDQCCLPHNAPHPRPAPHISPTEEGGGEKEKEMNKADGLSSQKNLLIPSFVKFSLFHGNEDVHIPLDVSVAWSR